MNLIEKWRRKFESSIMQGEQIMTPVLTNELPEDVKEAHEERTAVMQYDGGLNREEAERQAWCREVCMLTPEQGKLCERVKPCPRKGD